MADSERAGCSRIASCAAGDCKDIGAAEWWCVGKPAVEPSAVDGDLTVSDYERDRTLLSLEARIVDRADDQRSPEQFTVRAEAHCTDDLVPQRKAAGWHVYLMLVARRGWGRGERQGASGIALGRADGCGSEQSDSPHRHEK